MQVLNDGTILNNNGLTVGRITIDSDKYKETLLSSIEGNNRIKAEYFDGMAETLLTFIGDDWSSKYETLDKADKDSLYTLASDMYSWLHSYNIAIK